MQKIMAAMLMLASILAAGCSGEVAPGGEQNEASKKDQANTQKPKTVVVNEGMSKAEIIRKGLELGLDYGLTWSCYDPHPDGVACGFCDSCQLRLKGFSEAGMQDPISYASR